ncbi:hypothetical protein [Castellaniella ginsengisoli]|uniref:Bacteriophage tail tape measure N-terminal domain-containing protein n=1 Tax=Castellaniella ginsengisoli TaxID=546114 RepID=A0AB39CUB3_9BURK
MPSVLKNFLIGVGLDTEDYDKGAKRVEASLGRMRSVVGITGAAIAGAFAMAGTAAVARAKEIDSLNLAAEGLKTSPAYIYAYGRALAALGGDADNALAAIRSIEEAQTNLKLKGMLGPLEDVVLARGDIEALSQTTSGKDFLRTLAPMVQNMDKNQQQLTQRALGLTDDVMRSLRGGVDKFDAEIARAAQLLGSGFTDATEGAREFRRALAEVNTQFQGIGDTLAAKILPGFTSVLQSMGGFIDTHQEQINAALGVAADNPAATAFLTGGGAAGAAGVVLRSIGLRGLGTGLTRLGPYGMAAGGGLLAYDAAKDWSWGDWWGQSKSSARETWRGLTGQDDYSHLPDVPYGPEVPTVPIYSGGEVSNAEAAAISPSVVMIRDQRAQAQKSAAPQRVDVQNHIDMKLEIEGRALDSRITEVVERRERNTADDLLSSVDR